MGDKVFSTGNPYFFVDDYKQTAYCDVPKIASTSWNNLYYMIVDHDFEKRQEWWITTMQKALKRKTSKLIYNHWT